MNLSEEIKTLLLEEMRKQGITKAEMSRRLGIAPQTATRLFDLDHSTKIETLAKVAEVLGKKLVMRAENL